MGYFLPTVVTLLALCAAARAQEAAPLQDNDMWKDAPAGSDGESDGSGEWQEPGSRKSRRSGAHRVGHEPGYGGAPGQRWSTWLWAPSIQYTSEINGVRESHTATPADLLKSIRVVPFGTRYEGTMSRWTYWGQFEYVELHEEVQSSFLPALEVDIDLSQLTVEGGVRYRLFEWSWGKASEQVDLGLWGEAGAG